MNEVGCPACYDGEVWERCSRCNGAGEIEDGVCPACEGGGETKHPDPCKLCDATGKVTRACEHIYSAWKRTNAVDDDRGCTQDSLARYFRERDYLRRNTQTVRARRHPDVFGRVELVDPGARVLIALLGLAWGYGGEGPNGLADIIADLGFFDSDRFKAISYVADQPQNEGWTLSRRVEVAA